MAKAKTAAKTAAPKTPTKPKVRKAPEGAKAATPQTLNGWEVGAGDPPPVQSSKGKYSALRELPVGKYVTIPVEHPTTKYRDEAERAKAYTERKQVLRKQVYSAVSNMRKKDKKYYFRVAVVEAGVRVWRIASK